jgi:hypothetical protein
MVGLLWSNDPKSYAGGSGAIGRASHARQVKGDDPEKNGYPGPPGWGLGHGGNCLTCVKKIIFLLTGGSGERMKRSYKGKT